MTLLLIAACFFSYALELGGDGSALCAAYGLIPAHPTAGSAVTSLFLHDPASWMHIGGNMAFLFVLGRIVERERGSLYLGFVYFAAGLGGALTHVLVNPAATDPMVGASAAIFGLAPIAMMLRPRLIGFIGSMVAFNIAELFMGSGGSVAVGAHVGGFVVGSLFVLVARASRSDCLEAA